MLATPGPNGEKWYLPQDYIVHQNASGYNDEDGFIQIALHFLKYAPAGLDKGTPLYLFIDGHHSHWAPAALKILLEHNVHVFFLRSNNSDSDQPNDNGPNSTLKAAYGRFYDDFFALGGSMFGKSDGISAPFFNEIFERAWNELKLNPSVVKKAYELVNMLSEKLIAGAIPMQADDNELEPADAGDDTDDAMSQSEDSEEDTF